MISKKTKLFIKNNIALVITIVFAMITFGLWICSPDEKVLSDLCLNLLAGFISSIFVIAVIDNIVKKQKEAEKTPLKLALYRDVQMFASRIISMWGEMYSASVKTEKSLAVTALFTSEEIEKISFNLDLDGKPNVYPETNWFKHIEMELQEILNRGNKILDRYMSEANPDLLQEIHYTINDGGLVSGLKMISLIRRYDINEHRSRVPLICQYTSRPQEKDYMIIKKYFRGVILNIWNYMKRETYIKFLRMLYRKTMYLCQLYQKIKTIQFKNNMKNGKTT